MISQQYICVHAQLTGTIFTLNITHARTFSEAVHSGGTVLTLYLALKTKDVAESALWAVNLLITAIWTVRATRALVA